MGSMYVSSDNHLGQSSFHFEETTNGGSYISFENIPHSWLLDDGTKPPLKKYFEQVVYIASTRKFKG